MSCHVMSCHVMSCHVMSCHVMPCHVMLCYVELNDRHLRSHGEIGDCEQSRLKGVRDKGLKVEGRTNENAKFR